MKDIPNVTFSAELQAGREPLTSPVGRQLGLFGPEVAPANPFSVAGKGKGTKDERHLWPEFFRLIKECKPKTIFGEQVENAIRLGWLDGVLDNLENLEYSTFVSILPAAAVGTPHIRSRIFWSATLEVKNEKMQKVQEDLFGEQISQRYKSGGWAEKCLQRLRSQITPTLCREKQGENQRLETGLVSTKQRKSQKTEPENTRKKYFNLDNLFSQKQGKEKNLPFDLDQHKKEIKQRIAPLKCELTGIHLDPTKKKTFNSISLDRIVPEKGYVYHNVRIVSYAVNCALGTWGEEKLRMIAKKILEKR